VAYDCVMPHKHESCHTCAIVSIMMYMRVYVYVCVCVRVYVGVSLCVCVRVLVCVCLFECVYVEVKDRIAGK